MVAARAEKRPAITLRQVGDGQSLALGYKSGEFDLAFNLPVESLPQLKADNSLTVKSFAVGYQYMVGVNARRPGLGDVRVRQAIAKTLDRAMMVRAMRAGEASLSA